MYQTSLFFRVKRNDPNVDNNRLLEILFQSWVDEICNNKAQFKIERNVHKDWEPGMVHYTETLRVDFEREEDAVVLKLKGLPEQYHKYLELLH